MRACGWMTGLALRSPFVHIWRPVTSNIAEARCWPKEETEKSREKHLHLASSSSVCLSLSLILLFPLCFFFCCERVIDCLFCFVHNRTMCIYRYTNTGGIDKMGMYSTGMLDVKMKTQNVSSVLKSRRAGDDGSSPLRFSWCVNLPFSRRCCVEATGEALDETQSEEFVEQPVPN